MIPDDLSQIIGIVLESIVIISASLWPFVLALFIFREAKRKSRLNEKWSTAEFIKFLTRSFLRSLIYVAVFLISGVVILSILVAFINLLKNPNVVFMYRFFGYPWHV